MPIWNILIGTVVGLVGVVLAIAGVALLVAGPGFFFTMFQIALANKLAYVSLSFAVAAPIMALGGSIAFYLPFVPILVYTLASISWIFSVIESMVAAPIVLLGVTFPKGHDLLGAAQQGFMLFFGVFIRPVLIVIGFIFSILVTSAAVTLASIVFGQMVLNMFASLPRDSLLSVIMVGAVMVVYAIGMLNVVDYSFSFVFRLPVTVMKWIGLPTTDTMEEQLMQDIKGGVSSSFREVGEGFGGMAGGLSEGGLQQQGATKQVLTSRQVSWICCFKKCRRSWNLMRYLVLLLLFAVDAAFASGTTYNLDSDLSSYTPDSDISLNYLRMLFAPAIDNASLLSDSNVPGMFIAKIFNVFNAGILIIIFGFASFTVFNAALLSATDSSMMKRKIKPMTTFRNIAGAMLVAPTTSGYASIQLALIKIVILGVGLANGTWQAALHHLERMGGNSMVSAPAMMEPDVNQIATKFLGIYNASRCLESHRYRSTNSEKSRYGVWYKQPQYVGGTGKVVFGKMLVTADGPVYTSECGEIQDSKPELLQAIL